MDTNLYSDSIEGTYIVFYDRPRIAPELRITVAHAPFGKLTMKFDLDDVDRLLAVVEHAADPVMDLAEFFGDVYFAQPRAAERAAVAFVNVAGSIAETVR